MAAELGLRDGVEFRGQMSQTELLAYYRQASLFALACEVQNDGDRDGIPNVLVEAMAMGLPVVSTSISGIPELIESGVNGLLVPEKDPVALAEGIETFLRQPEMARRLGLAGRAKVERDFDAKRNVEQIGELLRGALANSAHAADSGRANLSSGLLRAEKIRQFPLCELNS
jgi:glycosyltransferase involved in cell wall biosynthesis